MEPMTLGSPSSSPNTSPIANPNFLPAFLMGESQTSSPRPTNISPIKNRSMVYKSGTPGTESRDRSRYLQETGATPTFNISGLHEKSGPPSRSLFDTIDNRNELVSPLRELDQIPGCVFSTPQKNVNFPKNLNDSLNKSSKRVANSEESFWVTVLGFPPHAASIILAQFAQCGTIIDKKFPSEGNWVNIRYSSSYETAKALSYNGKLISGSIMVGVVPCIMAEYKDLTLHSNVNTINESGNLTVTSPNRARPLTKTAFVKPTTNEVLSPQNVPQKSTGFVSKAMEYVFGW